MHDEIVEFKVVVVEDNGSGGADLPDEDTNFILEDCKVSRFQEAIRDFFQSLDDLRICRFIAIREPSFIRSHQMKYERPGTKCRTRIAYEAFNQFAFELQMSLVWYNSISHGIFVRFRCSYTHHCP